MKKVLIIGGEDKSALMLQAMREKYGNDIVLVTAEEALEKGLTESDFVNTPTMKITAPPEIPFSDWDFKSGKERRRERRAKERKANKKQKW